MVCCVAIVESGKNISIYVAFPGLACLKRAALFALLVCVVYLF